MSSDTTNSLISDLLSNQNNITKDVDKLYRGITQIIVENEGVLKRDICFKELENGNLRDLTNNLDEVKDKVKKTDDFYIEHHRMAKETQMLEKILGIYCTIVRSEENSHIIEVYFTFKEQSSVQLMYDFEYGSFALRSMKPKHKNVINIMKFLEETQDIQEFMTNIQQYFDQQHANKENEAMEIDPAAL